MDRITATDLQRRLLELREKVSVTIVREGDIYTVLVKKPHILDKEELKQLCRIADEEPDIWMNLMGDEFHYFEPIDLDKTEKKASEE